MPRSTIVAWLLVAALAPALAPAPALADADPASDVLLGTSVFYPYSPPVSGSLQKQLNAEAAAAARAHFPIKIAIIASPVDLEISFNGKQSLLVVMANGYGSAGLPAPATAAVGSLPRPSGHTGEALAQAALAAVPKLASAAGHPIGGVSAASPGGSGGGSSTLLIVIVAVVAVLAAALVIGIRRRAAAR